jgi:hypothetical protein
MGVGSMGKDETVRDILKRRKVRSEEVPGLCVPISPHLVPHLTPDSFLNDIERVTSPTYAPSDGNFPSFYPHTHTHTHTPLAHRRHTKSAPENDRRVGVPVSDGSARGEVERDGLAHRGCGRPSGYHTVLPCI